MVLIEELGAEGEVLGATEYEAGLAMEAAGIPGVGAYLAGVYAAYQGANTLAHKLGYASAYDAGKHVVHQVNKWNASAGPVRSRPSRSPYRPASTYNPDDLTSAMYDASGAISGLLGVKMPSQWDNIAEAYGGATETLLKPFMNVPGVVPGAGPGTGSVPQTSGRVGTKSRGHSLVFKYKKNKSKYGRSS